MHTAETGETLEGREDDMNSPLISLGKVLNAAKSETHERAPGRDALSEGGCEHHSCHFNTINPIACLALAIVSGRLAVNSISTDAIWSSQDGQEERERAEALMTALGWISQARVAAGW